MPLAVPAAAVRIMDDPAAAGETTAADARRLPRQVLLARLGAEIAAHERRAGLASPRLAPHPPAPAAGTPDGRWGFGAPEIDRTLVAGLDTSAMHEIKPACSSPTCSSPGHAGAGGRAAALTLALCLAARRLALLDAAARVPAPPILLCITDAVVAELGRPHRPGLVSLGLDPGRLVLVQARRSADVLAASEEGLRSSATALVLAMVDAVGTTPARRLALAAEVGATPCLLLTAASRPGAMSANTRWRVAPRQSAPHPFDAAAPGNIRHAVSLERCRLGTARGDLPALVLEWCHETYRFHVAAPVADRAHATPPSRLRAR